VPRGPRIRIMVSSIGFAHDDVSIKCKVRRSQSAASPEFDECQYMTCTVRHGNRTSVTSFGSSDMLARIRSDSSNSSFPRFLRSSSHGGPGPEIILRSISPPPDQEFANSYSGTSKFRSTSRDNNASSILTFSKEKRKSIDTKVSNSDLNRSALPPKILKVRQDSVDGGQVDESRENADCTTTQRNTFNAHVVPVTDIVNVDLYGMHGTRSKESSGLVTTCLEIENCRRMSIVTTTNGYFQFTFDSKNGHDVMVAFLQSCVPTERFTTGALERQPSHKSSQSFDIEKLTAKEIKGWVDTETVTDRLRRRMFLVASRLGEYTLSIPDCVCGESNIEERTTALDDACPTDYVGFEAQLDDINAIYSCKDDKKSSNFSNGRNWEAGLYSRNDSQCSQGQILVNSSEFSM